MSMKQLLLEFFKSVAFFLGHKILQKEKYLSDQREQNKGNLAWCFHSFLQVFEKSFCRKSPVSTGRNDRLKPGKLLNLIRHIGHQIIQFSIALL